MKWIEIPDAALNEKCQLKSTLQETPSPAIVTESEMEVGVLYGTRTIPALALFTPRPCKIRSFGSRTIIGLVPTFLGHSHAGSFAPQREQPYFVQLMDLESA